MPAAPIAPVKAFYTVVVPFFNEAGSLESLLAEIQVAMQALGKPWQAVLIDDCSTDDTRVKLAELTRNWPNCKILRFASNQGQAAALWSGFRVASGEWIITLDGDGQNVPADLSKFLPLADTHDMVVGIRVQRQDSWLRRTMSRVANHVRGRFLNDNLSDSGCALKLFRREVADAFLPIRTLYSFMPALAIAAGYRVAEIPVQHRERIAGKSNYGLFVMAWRPLIDMLMIGWYIRRRIATRPTVCERHRQ